MPFIPSHIPAQEPDAHLSLPCSGSSWLKAPTHPLQCAAQGHVPVLLSGLWTAGKSSAAFPSSPPLAIKIPGFALRSAAVMTRLEMLLLGSVLSRIISKARHLPHSAGVLNKTASSLGCRLPSNLQYTTARASDQSLAPAVLNTFALELSKGGNQFSPWPLCEC